MNASEYIQLGGLIVTVFSAIIIPFLDRPFLTYSDILISPELGSSIHKFSTNISNHGLKTANDVVLSISANNNETKFFDFALNPSVPEHVIQNTSSKIQIGHGILEINKIPSRQTFMVQGYLNSSENIKSLEKGVVPSLFSSETTGFTDGYLTLIYILIIIFVFVAVAAIIYLISQDNPKLKAKIVQKLSPVPPAGVRPAGPT